MLKNLDIFPGGKTYGLGVFLLVYILIQHLNKQPLEQEILFGVLSAMGVTMRMGVEKAEKAGNGPVTPPGGTP